MTDARKEEIKFLLKDYLEKILGIDIRKNFKCLNPEHDDKTPSMSYKVDGNYVKCFGKCNKIFDIFDLIGFKTGLKGQELFEFTEAFCIDKLGLRPTGAKEVQKVSEFLKDKVMGQSRVEEQQEAAKDKTLKYEFASHDTIKQFEVNKYIEECKSHIKETDYFNKRGITEEIQEKFNLGFDPNFKAGADTWSGAVIKTSPTSYIVRNTDMNADGRNKVRKTNGESYIFNHKYIMNQIEDYLFICEGEFDALSFEVVGSRGVGLGGIGKIDEFVRLLAKYRPVNPVIIVLDNDKAGKEAAKKLIKDLEKEKIPYYHADWFYTIKGENSLTNYKDANEFLVKDKENFIQYIERAKIKAVPEGQVYKQKSNFEYIQSFISDIYTYNNAEYTETGFKNLDEVLGGGLREGLYVCGAISSLGKTTFVLQLCDNIAASGKDVMFFSYEMSRRDLMAKSISRNTYLESVDRYRKRKISDVLNPLNKFDNVKINFKSETFARTSTEITKGSNYKYYTDEQINVIEQSFKNYEKIAKNFYIVENDGDMSVSKIAEKVKKHIGETGKPPLVVVDYLQIVKPYREGATDKQNIDNTVLELKRLARECGITVIGISSFNRDSYSKQVDMSSLKESGGLEYGADVVIGLQFKIAEGTTDKKNGVNFNLEKSKPVREIELWVLKNRNGRTGCKVELNYKAAFNYFVEV